MKVLICEGCVFYHPGRRDKKCSCLPRAVPEEMERCSVRLGAPSEAALAMRVVTAADIPEEPEQKGRRKR